MRCLLSNARQKAVRLPGWHIGIQKRVRRIEPRDELQSIFLPCERMRRRRAEGTLYCPPSAGEQEPESVCPNYAPRKDCSRSEPSTIASALHRCIRLIDAVREQS